MQDGLEQLEPRSLWGHFAGIAATPRPSKHEERIVEWVRTLAQEHHEPLDSIHQTHLFDQ